MPERTVQSSAVELGDKACIYCGYNLRGLTAHDRCPECGKPAVDSLLGDHLRDAEAPWLRTLLRGIGFAVAGYGVLIVYWLMMIGYFWTWGAVNLPFYSFLVDLVGWVILLTGIWLLTAREPSDSLLARRRGLAWVLRVAAVITTFMPFLERTIISLLATDGNSTVIPAAALFKWMARVGFVEAAPFVVVHSLLWLHLRRIIDRTPRIEVRRRLTMMIWLSVSISILANPHLLGPVFVNILPLPTFEKFTLFFILAPSIMILHHAVAIYLLLQTGKAIKRTIGYWS